MTDREDKMNNDIKKDVLISVTGKRDSGSGEEPVSLLTQGRFYRKGGLYYISYDESELTGMQGTHTTVKVSQDGVSVIRTGKYPSQMEFKTGGNHMTMYQTDYGALTVVISTKYITAALTDDGGTVDILYNLVVENEPAYANHLVINVMQKAKGEPI